MLEEKVKKRQFNLEEEEANLKKQFIKRQLIF
ncbi:hypothetical protein LLT7_05160 [Lactococcus cremoris subsp. cremoris TIFN7]|nr:hypothetical protein LLT7_05160 [Lactococcus cremoris subsp. cremoris TIFN7]